MEFDVLLPTSWSTADIRVRSTIAEHLEENDLRTAVLTPTPDSENRVGDGPTATFNVESLSAGDSLDPDEIEDRFCIPSTKFLCHTEQTYFNLDYDSVLERARTTAAGIDRLFSEHDFNFAFQARGGELYRLLAHYAIKRNGGTSVWWAFSPFEDTTAFSTHLDNTWDAYETTPYDRMNEDERQSTRDFMQTFRSKGGHYTHRMTPDSNENTGTLQSLIDRAADTVFPKYPRHLPASLMASIKQVINRRINEFRYPSPADSKQQCETNDYVFFPLQLPAESRLTIYSPEYYRQNWILEYLSRSVPHEIAIFVKQHPNHVGKQSPVWIDRLSRLPGVEFINPHTTAHHVIEHAEATVVTNNTVGFESLFYSTPLIVLGNAFYDNTPAVYRVGELHDLKHVIRTAIDKGVSDEARIASVFSLRQSVFDVPPTDDFEEFVSGIGSAFRSFIEDETAGHSQTE